MGMSSVTLKKHYRLFTIFGIRVAVHPSVVVLGLLMAWRLASFYYPETISGLTAMTYASMAGLTAVGLILSVVLHEIAHTLAARRRGLAIRGVTVYVFGGVADFEDEPATPGAEFVTAAVGPLTSLLLAVLLELASAFAPPVAGAVIHVVAGLNLALAIFNLVPAFPLDGGAMLRAAVWAYRLDRDAATRTTVHLGQGCGALLAAIGVFTLLGGGVVDGLWRLVLGVLLFAAARMAAATQLMTEVLRGRPVGEVVNRNLITVKPESTLDEVADALLGIQVDRGLPVTDADGTLLGFIDGQTLLDVPPHAWLHRTAQDVVRPCEASLLISPDADAWDATRIVRRRGSLVVVDHGVLIGTLSMEDSSGFATRYDTIFGHPQRTDPSPRTTLGRVARLLSPRGFFRRLKERRHSGLH